MKYEAKYKGTAKDFLGKSKAKYKVNTKEFEHNTNCKGNVKDSLENCKVKYKGTLRILTKPQSKILRGYQRFLAKYKARHKGNAKGF